MDMEAISCAFNIDTAFILSSRQRLGKECSNGFQKATGIRINRPFPAILHKTTTAKPTLAVVVFGHSWVSGIR